MVSTVYLFALNYDCKTKQWAADFYIKRIQKFIKMQMNF